MNNKKEKKKKQLKHAKMRMHEQTVELKLNKRMERTVNKTIATNIALTSLPVYKTGPVNRFDRAEKAFLKIKDKYKNSDKKARQQDDFVTARALYRKEKDILHNEIKQINELNSKGKGVVKVKNESGNIIEVKDVNKYYTTKELIFPALKDIELHIKRGEFVVILGPSGSGKTTLLNTISGLDRATAGEVIINGINIQSLSTSGLTQFRRHNIGFVFQSYNLLSTLNASDNIEIGRSLQTNAHKRQDIDKLLNSMSMGKETKKRTYELSGGQQQRISIARALAKTPDILIGDEPTGALDQKTSGKVFELFQQINKKNKTTVIIVTHNQNIAKLANRVIRVKNGRIESIEVNDDPQSAKKVEI